MTEMLSTGCAGFAMPAWKDTKDLILDWKVGDDKADAQNKLSKIHNFSRNMKFAALAATIIIIAVCIFAGGILPLILGGISAAITYDIYRTLDNLQQLARNEWINYEAEAAKGERLREDFKAMTPAEQQKERDRRIGELCRGTGLLRFILGCYFKRQKPPAPAVPAQATGEGEGHTGESGNRPLASAPAGASVSTSTEEQPEG